MGSELVTTFKNSRRPRTEHMIVGYNNTGDTSRGKPYDILLETCENGEKSGINKVV
jgi:hypothetical protein